jgi:hypothetical protein
MSLAADGASLSTSPPSVLRMCPLARVRRRPTVAWVGGRVCKSQPHLCAATRRPALAVDRVAPAVRKIGLRRSKSVSHSQVGTTADTAAPTSGAP